MSLPKIQFTVEKSDIIAVGPGDNTQAIDLSLILSDEASLESVSSILKPHLLSGAARTGVDKTKSVVVACKKS